jgi:hypothetical protein
MPATTAAQPQQADAQQRLTIGGDGKLMCLMMNQVNGNQQGLAS